MTQNNSITQSGDETKNKIYPQVDFFAEYAFGRFHTEIMVKSLDIR